MILKAYRPESRTTITPADVSFAGHRRGFRCG